MQIMENKKSTIQLLVWEYNNTFFAANIENCIETKEGVEIFPIPYSQNYIAGMANLRGEISLVYDLGILLKQKKRVSQNKEIIVRLQINEKSFSVIVDSIVEVIQESTNNFKIASSYLSKEECEFTSHILDSEFGLIQILNLEKIFNA